MNNLSKKIVSMLKSNAYDSVYINTLAKLPIVVTREGTSFINGDAYPVNYNNKYTDGVGLIVKDILRTTNKVDDVTLLKLLMMARSSCKIVNVKKFHYDDVWYSHRNSVDYPEETFGILELDNMPYRPFNNLYNKKSFICRMDQIMFNGLMTPFMLFVNGKFVNWNTIDIVFDCNTTYLLLHGKEYNYFNLENADISMVILPFKVEYAGIESDDIWELNYNMLKNYMQDSLHINDDDKIEIEVPTMYSIYKKRGMVYNVGAWIYTQLYMNHLGLLSKERTDKLKKIILTKITYDDSGNIISTYNTKFNAFDKDSYDTAMYESICHCDLNYLKERAIFRFDNNGLIDLENGNNIIANLDESMTCIIKQHSDSKIILDYSKINETLFRESIVVFKSGLFDPQCVINDIGFNIFTINNSNNDEYVSVAFKPDMIECIKKHSDNFIDKDYFANKIVEYLKSDTEDLEITDLISLSTDSLNYLYYDNLLYDKNYNNGFNTVIGFNPLLLNDLTKSTIKSTVVSGKTANNSLTSILGDEKRSGIKIPRYKYSDHETYVIIFLNGELIENYNEMYAASNYFFLPVDKEFANGDVIEFLFFTYCDNNEISFNMTDNMISKLTVSEDPEFYLSDLFKEYIRPEDIKIFAKYPKEIMIYKELIEEKDDLAFNVSYRKTANDKVYLFKNVVENKENEFTAVSSRKFIYERLYVDQKAYRIKLNSKFKYCDNQKQYLLFINGRRMEDDAFFITVPKYSRPFWGIYLYTRKFVSPEDRIEIFYVPEELCNMNTVETPATFDSNGYIETERNNLSVPYYNDFYLYFINGKKIPYNDIIPIDSHTVRVKSDTKSLLRLNINPAYRSTHPEIIKHMQGKNPSRYDKTIQYIKDVFGYEELDNLFNSHIKMSDIEEDAIWCNVDRIAIINEIVRDFWVASGYAYNEKPFVYDYELDEIVIKDNSGNYVLPAMDANPYINILKNNIRLLYFNINKGAEIYEIGSTVNNLVFDWDFTNPINNGTVTLVSQYVNGIELDKDARKYICPNPITEDMSFYFQFNTIQALIDKRINIKFYNGVYYGTIDEDLLQHYNQDVEYLSINKLIGVVPKNKRIPSSMEQALECETLEVIKKDNYIIYNLKYLETDLPAGLVDFEGKDDNQLIAIYEDGRMYKDIIIAEDYITPGVLLNKRQTAVITEELKRAGIVVNEYRNKSDLGRLMNSLERVHQDTPTLDFESYKIGSNKYFVYACPKRLAFDENGKRLVHFTMPDLNDRELIDYGKDDHTTPIYTNGEFNTLDNTLIKLDECVMEFMDEFEYTNPSGYTETYVMWKTNGFFTRKYDDYEFKMSIKSEEDFVDIEEIPTEFDNNNEPIRIVNTASPLGANINENIVFINTLIW